MNTDGVWIRVENLRITILALGANRSNQRRGNGVSFT